jgi:hypothetical protein
VADSRFPFCSSSITIGCHQSRDISSPSQNLNVQHVHNSLPLGPVQVRWTQYTFTHTTSMDQPYLKLSQNSGAQIFQTSRNHLKILGARRVKQVPYWGSISVRCHHTTYSHVGFVHPCATIVSPKWYVSFRFYDVQGYVYLCLS